MAYIHIARTGGRTIEDFRMVSEKVEPPRVIDGLLVQAAGSDDNGLHVVTVWQSKAHADRYEAEQLFPAFQALGIASDIVENTVFTSYEVDDLYIASPAEPRRQSGRVRTAGPAHCRGRQATAGQGVRASGRRREGRGCPWRRSRPP